MTSELNFRKGFQKFNDSELENVGDRTINENKSDINLEEDNEDVDGIMDEIGFTKYHLLVFTIAASILICGGVQESMLSFVVSFIGEREELTEVHYAVITTSEYGGYILASIMVNVITNNLSYKRAIQIFTILNLTFTGISISHLNFYIAVCNRFIIGFCFGMIEILIYMNLVEISPTKIRGFVGSFILIFSPLGQLIISVSCYFNLPSNREIEDINYRNLILIPYLTMAILLIALLPYLKESVRRLIALDKLEEGAKVMKQISKSVNYSAVNKEEMIDRFLKKRIVYPTLISHEDAENNPPNSIIINRIDRLNALQESSKRDVNKKENLIVDSLQNNRTTPDYNSNKIFLHKFITFLNGKYKKFSIILSISAILTNFIFHGTFFLLPTTAPKLNKSNFMDVIMSVSIEIASALITSMIIENKRVGRLRSLRLGFLFTLITCIVCLVIRNDYIIVNCTLKFFISIPTNVLIVYGSEIYESKIRTFGVSFLNFCKRSATIMSPFTVTYLEYKFGFKGPYYFFAPACLICLYLSFLLDVETRGVPLDKIHLTKENVTDIDVKK